MLKQLKLNAELKKRQTLLEQYKSQQTEFIKRSKDLEKVLEEAKTDEDFEVVGQGVEALSEETLEADLDAKILDEETEISNINTELDELREKAKNISTPKRKERGDNMNKLQIRELLKSGEYFERSEVKEFYEKVKNIRSVTGGELTVPNIVVNRIMDIIGDYCTLYPLVDKIKVSGTTRILIDTDTTPAEWIEQAGKISEGNVGAITNVDFDGFKVGKVTFVDNSVLQDSIINLDEYVTKKIARALGLALDKAILKGEGAASKQPKGIIPSLTDDYKVTVTSGDLADIVSKIGLIDTGDDSVGEIVAVMKRKTYYDKFVKYTINTDSNGSVVGKLPNLTEPDLLGIRIVFNQNIGDSEILFGDMSKYTIVERETITIDKSEHVKFSEDQTGFRGKGRFDGKPTNTKAFALVTLGE